MLKITRPAPRHASTQPSCWARFALASAASDPAVPISDEVRFATHTDTRFTLRVVVCEVMHAKTARGCAARLAPLGPTVLELSYSRRRCKVQS